MIQKSIPLHEEIIERNNDRLDTVYYQDEGDPLAGFRRIIPGGAPYKNDKDAFDHDSDWKQHQRDERLRDSQRMGG